MNHLTARRHARQVHTGRHPPPFLPSVPGLPLPPPEQPQDAFLDCNQANVATAVADPYVVSHITTGYSDRNLEFTEHTLVTSWQDLSQPEEPT
jgi:hypothetical protein